EKSRHGLEIHAAAVSFPVPVAGGLRPLGAALLRRQRRQSGIRSLGKRRLLGGGRDCRLLFFLFHVPVSRSPVPYSIANVTCTLWYSVVSPGRLGATEASFMSALIMDRAIIGMGGGMGGMAPDVVMLSGLPSAMPAALASA